MVMKTSVSGKEGQKLEPSSDMKGAENGFVPILPLTVERKGKHFYPRFG